ncbi:hypothetical protein B0H14DRAFT_3619449, partial [Mycena olivaceomarginata]
MASSRNYPRFVDRLWNRPGAVCEAVRIDGKPDLNCPPPIRSRVPVVPPVSTSTGLLFRSPCLIFRTTLGWLLPWRGRAFSTVCRFGICGRHRSSDARRNVLPYSLGRGCRSFSLPPAYSRPIRRRSTRCTAPSSSSYLPPPFPPHCNSLLVASSPIHPPLPAMSSRSLRSSTHPWIQSISGAVRFLHFRRTHPHPPSRALTHFSRPVPRAHRTQRFYFPAFRRPTTNPRIRISTY